MRRIGGYAQITSPERQIERDTSSCGHCSAVTFIKPGSAATVYLIWDPALKQWREEPGAFCRVCMRPVCLRCHEIGTCVPLERFLERAEAGRRG